MIYGEGLKQDYGGHDSKYHDNLNLVSSFYLFLFFSMMISYHFLNSQVHPYDGQQCINAWPFKTGKGPCGDWSKGDAECSHAHRFVNNKCLLLKDTKYSPGVGGCAEPTKTAQGAAHLANNSYFTPNGTATSMFISFFFRPCSMISYIFFIYSGWLRNARRSPGSRQRS